jgi:hypothetical protein
MKSLKLLSLVVAFVAVSFGQDNWKIRDTCQITDFKTTALFISKTMNFSNAEDKLLVFTYDDTLHANRSADSVNCEIGYMLGAPFVNLSSKLDTVWSSALILDTINSVTASAAAKKYDPSKYGGTAAWGLDAQNFSTRLHGQIDTTVSTASSAVIIPFNPLWCPVVRFYLKGLADNCGTYIKARLIFLERIGVNVRQQ